MKHIVLIASFFLLYSCQSSLSVISAKKKMIYPGVPTLMPSTKFVIIVDAKYPKRVTIDSLTFVENSKCYKMEPYIKTKNSSFVKEIRKEGIYAIEATLKSPNKRIIANNCSTAKNGNLTIFYHDESAAKQIEIDSFMEEKETRR
ncbi:hypothetical protein [Tenacibaculum amylolyticum]|uniref:hypothetical protein n=1 Tax=Tenacibaculum amylolyticum TaxID=104269 RepID=UPI0038964BC0